MKNGKMENGSPADAVERCACFVFKAEILSFINWYKDLYMSIKGVPHPNLKYTQVRRIHDTLWGFCEEWGIECDCLYDMAYSFFANVAKTDHNLNHFATRGILAIRIYDSGTY